MTHSGVARALGVSAGPRAGVLLAPILLMPLLLTSARAEAEPRAADEPRRAPANTPISVTVNGAYLIGERAGRPLGFLTGSALAGLEDGDRMDVVFVIDASSVTAATAGSDIDGDGRVSGRPGLGSLFGRGAGGDSILASEVAAIEAVLGEIDSRVTRVGVVAYAGGAEGSADHAWIQSPLTFDYEQVSSRLRELLEYYTPGGSSDLPAGLRLARVALVEAERQSRGAPARRRIVLLSEGYPESPRESQIRTEQRTIALARLLRKDGIRVHSYAVGPRALERPRAAMEVAAHSRGRYYPVEDPGDLPRVLPAIDLGQLEELRVTHVASGEPALEQVQRPDGRYSALVALSPGENEVEVYARASNGAERRVIVTLTPGAELDPRAQLELARLELGKQALRQLVVEPAEEDAAPVGARSTEDTPESRREVTIDADEPPGDVTPPR